MKFGIFNISKMAILILMLKMIFIKCLPLVRPKLVPKLKMFRIYWNFAHLLFWKSWSPFWCNKLFLLNTYLRYFKYADLDFKVKNNFCEIFTTWQAQITLEIKNFQVFFKFDAFDIANIPISILKSKIIFIKYLPPGRLKFVPKLKVLGLYLSLTHLIFQICRSQF